MTIGVGGRVFEEYSDTYKVVRSRRFSLSCKITCISRMMVVYNINLDLDVLIWDGMSESPWISGWLLTAPSRNDI